MQEIIKALVHHQDRIRISQLKRKGGKAKHSGENRHSLIHDFSAGDCSRVLRQVDQLRKSLLLTKVYQ
jgi:hypothetical protein